MTTDTDLIAGIAAAGFDPASSASSIIHAARILFDKEPFRDVTVSRIARAAGVNEVTVYRTFGSKDGLAAACWLGNVEKLRRGIRRDAESTNDPLERVEKHLARLARVSIQDQSVTLALLLAVEAQSIERGSKIAALDPRAIVKLPHLLEPLVASAQAAGQMTRAYSSFDVAAFLTNSVLIRLMTRQQASANDVARFVIDLGIGGTITRDARRDRE